MDAVFIVVDPRGVEPLASRMRISRDTYYPVLSSVKECRKYQRPGGVMKIYNTK